MADEILPITDPYQVPVVFVNQLAVRGALNGNVNLSFATARFSQDGDKVVPDLAITCRLRMDLFCAQQLRDALDQILAQNIKPTGKSN